MVYYHLNPERLKPWLTNIQPLWD